MLTFGLRFFVYFQGRHHERQPAGTDENGGSLHGG